ncbi:MAG: benzoylformate decarboxylase [Actinomycetota bacterium]|nr:benzoylformate decarboxylase [Actinomycetota bacterium]
MATVREVTYDLLRDLGMTTIFGNPGSTELPFLQDFPEDFRYVLGLQEASALGMADGYAQGTGQAAFVNLHTGPGLGNAMGAMVTAWHNRTPLVVTAGQQDRRHLVLDPMLSGNLVELAQPYVKRSHEPERAEDVPRELMRAYHMAMQAPKGPVFVSIPMNDWDVECEPPPSHEVYHDPTPDPEGINKFAQVLAGAERPAIVAGAWVDRKGAFYDTVALAEKLKAAVWEAPLASRAGFPQNHPLFQGSLAPAQKQVAEQLSGHDVVLVLGAPVFLYYPYVPGPVVKEGTEVLQITGDPEKAARAALGTSLFGNVAYAVRQLLEMLPEKPDRPVPPVREAPEIPEPATPIPPAYLIHTLAQMLPDETSIFEESGSSRGIFHEYVRPSWPGAYFNAASGSLGYAMPASVGYKLAMPERPVVCLIGDGSSMYSNQAMWTAAQYGAKVLFVVVDNQGYYILKGFRDAIGIDDSVPGLDVPHLDLVKVAEGMGVRGERVEDPKTLKAALERGFAAKWPYLINVMVEPQVPELPS